MKWSIYNTILPYEKQFALYNSYTQKVIFIEPNLKELLSAGIIEGIDNLADYHPTFYEYLKGQEFLVETNLDEVARVREISSKIDNDDRTYMLVINPTMNCNFKCWYCYETHIKQSRLNKNTISRINKFIEKKVSNPNGLQKFVLSFFGGEPLLYFKDTVVPIIDFAKEACDRNGINLTIGFTTNGYLINEDFLKYFADKGISCGLQITLDGYGAEHDKVRYVNAKKGSYTEIIKNIRKLILNNHSVRLRVNYTDENINNSHKIAQEFIDIDKSIVDNNLAFDFHRVWQNHSEGVNIDEQVEFNLNSIRKSGFNVQSNSSINNVVDSCYADKRNHVTINYNADIYKCTARDFTKENRTGYIDEEGELIWENDHLEKRMNIKFKNRPCQTCRIMPLCGGGCSQHSMDNEGIDYCIYNGDEQEKNMIIKSKIDEIVREIAKKRVTSTEVVH